MKNNLFAFYGLRMISSFWLIVPAMVPFYSSCGLGATELLTIQAVFIAVMLVMEIPSGYLADILGRKNILIISAFMLPLGLIVYSVSCGFWGFVLAETFIALSYSFRSGTDSALLYDTLKENGIESCYNKYEGRGMAIERLGDATGAILGGIAASYMLRLPFYLNIATAALLIPIAFLVKEPERKEKAEGKRPLLEASEIIKYCIKHHGIFPYMVFAAITVRFGVIGVWGYFLYYTNIGINVLWFGLLHALFAASSAAGSYLSAKLGHAFGEKKLIILSLLQVPVFALLGLFKSIWIYPLILLNGFVMNAVAPALLSRVNDRVGSKLRATAISFNNMIGAFVFMIFSPLYGFAADSMGIMNANLLLAGTFGLMAALSLAHIKLTGKNSNLDKNS